MATLQVSKIPNLQDLTVLEVMKFFDESEKPKLDELAEIITPKHAVKWKIMGCLLKLSSGELDIIEHDCRDKAVKCCNEMFSTWLEKDRNATWGKLKEIFNSPAITCEDPSSQMAKPNGVQMPPSCNHQANAVYCIARIFAPSWRLVSGALNIPRHVINEIYKNEKSNCVIICEKLIEYWFKTRSEANIYVLIDILNEPYIRDELKDKITLIQANLNGLPVQYPDIFPRPIAENYTCMIVKVLEILEKFPQAHKKFLRYLKYYPDTVNNKLFENTKNVEEIVDTLINEGQLSPINVNKLHFLAKSINCTKAKEAIEKYEELIEDKPINDELMWCLGQCQSPDRCLAYVRLIGDPKFVTYGDLKNAKAAASMYTDIPVHNMDEKLKGKGSTFIFWKISEEDAEKVHLSTRVSLSIKQTLHKAKIIEIGICYKEKHESICVEQLLVVTGYEGIMLRRQMLQQAKNEGLTINVRHAKVLFCGASCAGKTSFSRLLKNQKHETVYKSTPAGDAQQVLISGRVNVEGTNWINLDSKLETLEITKRLLLRLQNQKDTDINIPPPDGNTSSKFHVPVVEYKPPINNVQSNNQTVTAATHTNIIDEAELNLKESTQESNFCVPSANKLSTLSDDSTSKLLDENVQTNKPIGTEEQMVTFTDSVSESIPKTWDLFTLLDTGGQPEFINMLPAINSSTAITFVVLNISSGKQCLHNSVIAQYKCEGYNYSKCSLKYTNMHLLKCLLSSVTVAAMKKDNFQPDIIKKVTEDEQSLPVVGIIGTCADVLKKKFGKKYNAEMCEINKEMKKLVETMKKEDILVFWHDADENYVIPVDNTIPRDSQRKSKTQTIQSQTAYNIQRIREDSNEILKKKAQYEIPISWFILELELRNIDKVCIPINEVKNICNRIMPSHRKMNIEEIKEIMKFYHSFGMLLYFDKVDSMNKFVITNPQWLFINLSKIIMCQFEHNAYGLYGLHRIAKMHIGICHIELLRKLNLDLQGIKLESFIELLIHLKIIAPMMDSGYFMPTTLPLCNEKFLFTEKEYGKPSAFAADGQCIHLNVEPLLVEFCFGTIPRGFFGFLIVQLMQDNPDTFELYGKNDDTLRRCADLISFHMKPCYYVSLHDRISYLELQVRVKGNEPSCHYIVQTAVTEALKKVCEEFSWQFGDCRFGFLCREHSDDPQDGHLTLLSATQPIPDEIPKYASCKSQQSTHLTKAHVIWFEELQEIPLSPDYITEGSNKPTIKQLMKYRARIAPHWRNLGIQLLEEKHVHMLKVIKENHPTDIEKCCTEMFNHWLDVDTEASWDKLIDALEQIGQNALAEKLQNVFKGPASSLTRQQLPQQQPQLQGKQLQQRQHQQQQQQQQQLMPQQPQSKDDEWYFEEDESVTPAATTTAYVLYDFEAKHPWELSVTANEVVMVTDDPGNEWLKVNRGNDSGYIPSAYVQFT